MEVVKLEFCFKVHRLFIFIGLFKEDNT